MKRAVSIPLSLAMVATFAIVGVPGAMADDDRVIKQTEEIIQQPAPSASGTVVTPGAGAMTYTGVVSEVNPSSQVIILRSQQQPAAEPVKYTFTPQTVFLDASGNTVSYQAIQNAPVKIEYYTENGKTIVRRVIQTGPVQVP